MTLFGNVQTAVCPHGSMVGYMWAFAYFKLCTVCETDRLCLIVDKNARSGWFNLDVICTRTTERSFPLFHHLTSTYIDKLSSISVRLASSKTGTYPSNPAKKSSINRETVLTTNSISCSFTLYGGARMM